MALRPVIADLSVLRVIEAVTSGDLGEMPVSPFTAYEIPYIDFQETPAIAEKEDRTITGQRGARPTCPGRENWSGRITVPLIPDAIGIWLKHLMTSPTTTGAGPYDHAFDEESGQPAENGLIIERHFPGTTPDDSYEVIYGVVVESITFPIGEDGQVELVIELRGQRATAMTNTSLITGGDTVVTYAHVCTLKTDAEIQIDGATTDPAAVITAGSLTLKNSYSDGVYTVNGGALAQGFRNRTFMADGTLDALFTSRTFFNQCANRTEFELLVSYKDTGGTDVLVLSLPECRLEKRGINNDGKNSDLTLSGSRFRAHNDDHADDHVCGATLTNTVASY
jgi:hypothetical protein